MSNCIRVNMSIYKVKVDYSIDNMPRWIVYKNNRWVQAFQNEQQAYQYVKELIS
mgnify:CR=1